MSRKRWLDPPSCAPLGFEGVRGGFPPLLQYPPCATHMRAQSLAARPSPPQRLGCGRRLLQGALPSPPRCTGWSVPALAPLPAPTLKPLDSLPYCLCCPPDGAKRYLDEKYGPEHDEPGSHHPHGSALAASHADPTYVLTSAQPHSTPDPGWSKETILTATLGGGFGVSLAAAVVLAVLLRRARARRRVEGPGMEPLASMRA